MIERRIEQLLFRSAPEKLAALLLDLSEQFGKKVGDHVLLDIHLTHQELANLTGSVRETVSDVLTDFRDRGWIAIERRRIRLIDLPEISRLTSV